MGTTRISVRTAGSRYMPKDLLLHSGPQAAHCKGRPFGKHVGGDGRPRPRAAPKQCNGRAPLLTRMPQRRRNCRFRSSVVVWGVSVRVLRSMVCAGMCRSRCQMQRRLQGWGLLMRKTQPANQGNLHQCSWRRKLKAVTRTTHVPLAVTCCDESRSFIPQMWRPTRHAPSKSDHKRILGSCLAGSEHLAGVQGRIAIMLFCGWAIIAP